MQSKATTSWTRRSELTGTRRRWSRFTTPIAAAAVTLGTLAAATPAAQASPSGHVKVSIATAPKLGKILVDQSGLALYYDTANKPGHWACSGGCLTAWPPLVLPKGQTAATAGKGITGLGTVHGPSGLQVTWDGKPLYTYVEDSRGKVLGQGTGGIWYVAQVAKTAMVTAAHGSPTTAKSSW
ncbi:MAG TPA: hypothetical protein VED59_04920 [Acidimicrobiales bacterium]|nr:hypothetical protein [Acidimicrobiales bacterium]